MSPRQAQAPRAVGLSLGRGLPREARLGQPGPHPSTWPGEPPRSCYGMPPQGGETLGGFQSTQTSQDPAQTCSASIYPGLCHSNQQPKIQRTMLGRAGGHHLHHEIVPKSHKSPCEVTQGWSPELLPYAPTLSLPLPSLPVPLSMLAAASLSSRAPTPLVPSKTSLSC